MPKCQKRDRQIVIALTCTALSTRRAPFIHLETPQRECNVTIDITGIFLNQPVFYRPSFSFIAILQNCTPFFDSLPNVLMIPLLMPTGFCRPDSIKCLLHPHCHSHFDKPRSAVDGPAFDLLSGPFSQSSPLQPKPLIHQTSHEVCSI